MLSDSKMLNYIRQNVEMGIDGIDMVKEHANDPKFRDLLIEQRGDYEKFFAECDKMLRSLDDEAEDLPVMAKMASEFMTTMKNLVERSDSSIAEDMMKGTNTGIIKLNEHLNDFEGDPKIKEMTKRLLTVEERNIDALKKFL